VDFYETTKIKKYNFKSTGDPDCKRWGFQEKV